MYFGPLLALSLYDKISSSISNWDERFQVALEEAAKQDVQLSPNTVVEIKVADICILGIAKPWERHTGLYGTMLYFSRVGDTPCLLLKSSMAILAKGDYASMIKNLDQVINSVAKFTRNGLERLNVAYLLDKQHKTPTKSNILKAKKQYLNYLTYLRFHNISYLLERTHP